MQKKQRFITRKTLFSMTFCPDLLKILASGRGWGVQVSYYPPLYQNRPAQGGGVITQGIGLIGYDFDRKNIL